MTNEQLLQKVERAISRLGIGAATLGRRACGDPKLVFEMRQGRELRSKTRERLLSYIANGKE